MKEVADKMIIEEAGAVMLADVAHWFGLCPEQALKKAPTQELPVPAFKIGSQKSPWLVSIHDVAAHVSAKLDAAREEHDAISAA